MKTAPRPHPRITVCASILLILLLLNRSVSAQLAAPVQINSPSVSAQIRGAQKVFLGNAGAQVGFPYDASVAYRQFTDDLVAWGRFTLVDNPADADLLFELRSAAPLGGVVISDGTGASYRVPTLQLSISDARTKVRLWVLSEPVRATRNHKDKTDWFALSVANLTTRVKELSGTPVSSAEVAALSQYPRTLSHKWVYAIIAVPVVVGIGGGLLLHHAYENSLNDQKTQADAFCVSNHIPLNQCAGG